MSRTRGLPREILNLDVAVVTTNHETSELLNLELQRVHARVKHVWPIPDLLPENVDVIYCDLVPDLSQRIPWVPGNPKSALILLVQPGPANLDLVRNLAPDAILHTPFVSSEVFTSVLLAQTHFKYAQRLSSRVEKLDETLRSVRAVERAKLILMTKRKMDEEGAYRHLRQEAMSRRSTISAVAAAIIDSYELIG